MKHTVLQMLLRKLGVYDGALDGSFGPKSRAALIMAMTSKNSTPLDSGAYAASAQRLGVDPKAIKAVVKVESGASGFAGGLPLILAEPHLFSRATGRKFDTSNPSCSYPTWDKAKYPKTQAGRWDQLCDMVSLDVDAGFGSVSYGRFQIVGNNFKACGFSSSFEHALAHSIDEESQLLAFEGFVVSSGLVDALRARNWAKFANGYNGPAYAQNKYDQKLAAAYMAAG